MSRNITTSDLISWLGSESIEFLKNISLSSFSWFKTGGNVSVIIFPINKNQLSRCINWIKDAELNFKVIGETSNLIFLDDIDYSVLISTTKLDSLKYNKDKSLIIAECGVQLPLLSRYALSISATGFEGLEGIPGTIGAAVYMNAGAYGDEIKDVIESVDVIVPNGGIKTYSLDELKLSHRNSVFRTETNEEVVVSASFRVDIGDPLKIYNRMSLFHNKRHKYQEFMFPTLGSIYSGSVYRALAKKDFWYKIVSSIYYLVFYKLKLFRRESPDNRKWLNDFTVKRFGITFDNQPYSNKDMNTLINNGHHTDELQNYLDQLHNLIGDDIVIENEIVQKF